MVLLHHFTRKSPLSRIWLQCCNRGLYASATNSSTVQLSKPRTKITTSRLLAKYKKQTKLTMVTAYDYPSAQVCDESLIDMILVGDSVAMVVMGLEDTVSVTMDAMVHHCQAVKRGSSYSFLVGDLPFGSYNTVDLALHNATRLLKEGGMDAVKLEGGTRITPQIKALTNAGICVVGHIGLTPQSYRSLGGFTVQGKRPLEAQRILQDAHDLVDAGVTAMVLEMVPMSLSKQITAAVSVPTIGIGAGPDTSGQVLVYHDLLGLFDKFQPKFSKQYANLRGDMVTALTSYRSEVMEGTFPQPQHSFEAPSDAKAVAKSTSGIEDITAEVTYRRNIAVIGGGAMGSLFAGKLSAVATNKVTVVSQWAEHVDAINRQGLQVHQTGRTSQQKVAKKKANLTATAAVDIESTQTHGADVVFILVKSRDTCAAAKTAQQLVKPGGTVITIQNGIGYEDIVKGVFGADDSVSLAFGITSCGARMLGPGAVQAAGRGTTTLFSTGAGSRAGGGGEKDRILSDLQLCVEDLQESGMRVEVQQDEGAAQQQIWRKLAINAVVNPLAALFAVSNGDLLSHAPYRRVLEALVLEVTDVAGHKMAWSAAELQGEVHNVLKLTSDNRNSMLSDVQRDATTEFEHINGEILKMAEFQKKEVPINSALATIFEALAKDKKSASVSSPLPLPVPSPMNVCTTIAEVREFRSTVSAGETVGFVPTMGALHSGHLTLIEAARERCDRVVVSIFVNPTQFAAHEDFGEYPSTLETDLALLSQLGFVDAVFTPSPSEMYPKFAMSSEQCRDNGQTVFVVPDRIETISAEGKSRPKFFTGVSTVCTKLFNIIQPQVAFFGQKDAVQVIAIQQIVQELNMPLEIEVVQTAREADGVAMSSRNVLLSPADRAVAPVIYRALSSARQMFEEGGERRVSVLRQALMDELHSHPHVHIEYISVADGLSAEELQSDEFCAASTLISVAVTIGSTRLIDNIMLNQ
jgi:3-methyl-2-oxobutanoate hydroxymethyltransferase/pantoate--beta-alanine ligase